MARAKNITPTKKAEILAKVDAGSPIPAVAKEYGIACQRIYNWISYAKNKAAANGKAKNKIQTFTWTPPVPGALATIRLRNGVSIELPVAEVPTVLAKLGTMTNQT